MSTPRGQIANPPCPYCNQGQMEWDEKHKKWFCTFCTYCGEHTKLRPQDVEDK